MDEKKGASFLPLTMTMKQLVQLCFLLILACNATQSAEILAIFTFPSVRASQFNKEIVISLLDAGHRITLLTPFVFRMSSKENLTVVELGRNLSKAYHYFHPEKLTNQSVYRRMHSLLPFEEAYCIEMMKTDVVEEALGGEKTYDIMLTQAMLMPECQLKIAERLQIPVIGTIADRKEMPTFGTGRPFDISFRSHALSDLGEKMTFQERVMNFWYHISSKIFNVVVLRTKAAYLCYKYFPNSPELPENSPALYFINSHLSISPRALPPNLIEVGGIHIAPAEPYNWWLKNFIEEAHSGVILFTLSSSAVPKVILPKVTSMFIEVFKSIPQRVVWKYDGVLKNLSKNVWLSHSIPQRDVLEHDNVIGFISHCGLSSMLEAVHTATPMIAIPLLLDQPSNAQLLENLGVAITIPKFELTKNRILQALNQIIHNSSYSGNMGKLSQEFKNRLYSPKERVVYWTEYVIKHKGATHLRTIDAPLYKYYVIDVAMFVSVFSALMIIPFWYMWTQLFVYERKIRNHYRYR